MSVRRLAEDQFQPAAFAFSDENAVWADKTIQKYPAGRQQSAVIPLLMRAQEQDGWVTRAAIEKIADMLDMAYIRVLEVATFYTQFQLHPVGTRAHVQVCGTTPCMLRGSEALMSVCKSKIHARPFERNAEGTLSWEEVECLGACVNAPMVMIGKDTYEDLTPERLEEIIDTFAAGNGASIKPGPQIDRIFSAPEGGPTSLTTEEPKARTRAKKTEAETVSAPADGAPVPPSEAARPKSTDAETNAALKTPATAPKAAAKNAKAAEQQPVSGTAPAEPAPAAAKAETAPAEKPSLTDKNRPAGIEKPAAPDDLKMISGVGPKIEATLNEIGIFTFAQVAGWKKAEREWVDGYLNFRGRIERDDWVKQAKALAKGGEAEYIKVFGKKPR
ncbi:NADH dehydrogenase subunit E [Rhizobium aethiopicum]|uniref:NADH dehydrogenase subunit E n=1 Tax=Rhizobium aethiopicum TaxID=1138170 RepID=A0A1C3Y6D5_9HYPH|nr:NADH-quinone oxidoreductase subunit E [Rhizobium aethiopicum]SCB60009.1 NADH dehydrogenase subunit E [Rhizobium aethiopicum]